ncbi:MAG: 30S ribosomal protein S16, partial [Candidatus Pacebacteria bacterium]|nr:30S ribosomal protein S16 [Candidatus Paceibacterota bacterium]
IRLQRVGRKNDPSFRVVVLEGTEGPKSGNHVDEIGFYNAVTKQKSMNTEKAKHWLAKGAQPSDTVYNMLVTEGVIAGKKKNVLPQKTPIVKEAPVVEEKPAPAVPEEAPVAEATPEETAPETPVEAAEVPVEETAVPAEEAPAPEETPAA